MKDVCRERGCGYDLCIALVLFSLIGGEVNNLGKVKLILIVLKLS